MDKDQLLQLLIAQRGKYVSGGEIAGSFGCSRTAVWKQVKALERDGFTIDAAPAKGYRLVSEPDSIRAANIRSKLTSAVTGRELLILSEAASTNTVAAERAQQGAAEGLVVVAERQTGGRGRLGRSWFSPPGNLYLSVLLRPAIAPQKAPLVTLMGAVAVTTAVMEGVGVAAGIKWPNDVLVSGKKVCGLLAEMQSDPDRVRHIVLGIGINVNGDLSQLPPEVRPTATTLAEERGGAVDRTALLVRVLDELDRWYRILASDEAAVLDAWRRKNVTLGRAIAVTGSGFTIEGTARDLDEEGRLVLETASGTRTVAAGDVTILKR